MNCASVPNRRSRKRRAGVSLIEALLSVVILGGMAAGVSALYKSGLDSVDAQGDAMVLDSYLRSRMEQLLSTPFASLADGNEVVTVGDDSYTFSWTISPTDLDGDTVDEPDAVSVALTVTETGDTLQSIVVDPADLLGKL